MCTCLSRWNRTIHTYALDLVHIRDITMSGLGGLLVLPERRPLREVPILAQESVAILCQNGPIAGLVCPLGLCLQLCCDHLPHIVDCQGHISRVLVDKVGRKLPLQGK